MYIRLGLLCCWFCFYVVHNDLLVYIFIYYFRFPKYIWYWLYYTKYIIHVSAMSTSHRAIMTSWSMYRIKTSRTFKMASVYEIHGRTISDSTNDLDIFKISNFRIFLPPDLWAGRLMTGFLRYTHAFPKMPLTLT